MQAMKEQLKEIDRINRKLMKGKKLTTTEKIVISLLIEKHQLENIVNSLIEE